MPSALNLGVFAWYVSIAKYRFRERWWFQHLASDCELIVILIPIRRL